MNINPIHLTDGYKVSHKDQYPTGITKIYSNLTPRESKIPGINKVVAFGIQGFIKERLIEDFQQGFFSQNKEEVVGRYQRRLDNYLGKGAVNTDHIAALHDLGYLPLHIKAAPEGSLVNIRVPVLTITNTKPEFFWLTNFLETLLSCELWFMMNSATIAFEYRKLIQNAVNKTSDQDFMPSWMGHDFSMRGIMGVEAASKSGAGHLLSFTGTDTIPAMDYLEQYYNANSDTELLGGSVPASEHSVMCLNGMNEKETFLKLFNLYPTGLVSVVSDTWDYWSVLTTILPSIKPEIMARAGKLVVRPDSGDPVRVVCGDLSAPVGSPEYKGSVELLWETFGGVVNSKGFKQLDDHIGLIYGDSITLDRAKQILNGLAEKGFAATNIVFGIGSFTYQYNTRDTLGFAMKATYGIVNGSPMAVYKKPKTDNGTKNSAKGLLYVDSTGVLHENVTPEEEAREDGLLTTVFLDGKLSRETNLQEIRTRITENLNKEIQNL